MQLQISKWLNSNRNYQEGIKLYRNLFGEDFLFNLFTRFENPFTKQKLFESLKAYADQNQKENSVKQTLSNLPDIHAKSPIHNTNLPEAIRAFNEEKAILFKEVLSYRRALKKTLNFSSQKGFLTIKEALSIMQKTNRFGQPVPFSISYITWSNAHQKGGQLISYNKAVISNLNLSGSRLVANRKVKSISKKNQNHWMNSTRNINPEDSHEVRKIHIWLIFELNGYEVTMTEIG